MFYPSQDLLTRVAAFNRIGQIVPPDHTFNADRVGFHTGMQLEELAEKIQAIAMGCLTFSARSHLVELVRLLDAYGKEFKEGVHQGAVLRANREALLDADIDIAVVTAGSMMYQTPRYRDAVQHVLDRNDAKFPDGVVSRDPATNKILKPAGWTAPDLTPFIVQPND